MDAKQPTASARQSSCVVPFLPNGKCADMRRSGIRSLDGLATLTIANHEALLPTLGVQPQDTIKTDNW